MSMFQIAFNNATKVATVQIAGDSLPAGSINIGTFDHVSDPDDQLQGMADVPDNHVLYHHVREALYKRSAADPANLAMFPDNITDMASIEIVIDSVANPVPVNTVLPAITGDLSSGSTLTTTNGTWANSPTSYTRQWKRCNNADGTGAVTDIGLGNLTYGATPDDLTKYVFCLVTATNANGSSAQPARSNVVGPIFGGE